MRGSPPSAQRPIQQTLRVRCQSTQSPSTVGELGRCDTLGQKSHRDVSIPPRSFEQPESQLRSWLAYPWVGSPTAPEPTVGMEANMRRLLLESEENATQYSQTRALIPAVASAAVGSRQLNEFLWALNQ
jgi:hypothetical protein